jgi:hypothetical protein
MAHVIFLTAAYNEHSMDAEQPLLVDDLRSVSVCHLRLGAPREEFIRVKHFILASQDDVEDFCATI